MKELSDPTSRGDLYLVDEKRIEEIHDIEIAKAKDLSDHIKILNECLAFIDHSLRSTPHSNEDELVVQRLAIRIFNSSAAALKLARAGYFQQCLMLIRDIIETESLLDLFSIFPEEIFQWRTLPPKRRAKAFRPMAVREKLDDASSLKNSKRSAIYKLFSTHGTHPSPEGFAIISQEQMTQIGPFPDVKKLRACIEDVTKYTVYASTIISPLIKNNDQSFLVRKNEFLDKTRDWFERYLTGKHD